MKVSEKVLVAETRDIDAAHLKLMLERNGCETEIVKKGIDILRKIESNQYSLIILNDKLQDIDGIDIVKQVREAEASSEGNTRVPILGLTSYSLPAMKKKFQSSGIDYCLSKPVYKNKLNSVLTEVFEKHQQKTSTASASSVTN